MEDDRPSFSKLILSTGFTGGSICMKIGIIRCRATENYCPGTTDFKTIALGKGSFATLHEEEELELIGFVSCGGCPGKDAVLRARELVRRGAQCIAFASCIKNGNPLGFPCPQADAMIEAVKRDLGPHIKILTYTHN